jgi:hypothetical protein
MPEQRAEDCPPYLFPARHAVAIDRHDLGLRASQKLKKRL